MPPKFSLQSVLDYRHSCVEAIEIVLGELVQAQLVEKELLEKLKSFQANLFDQIQKQQSGDLDLFSINHLHANLELVRERIFQVNQKVVALEEKINTKRVELVNAKQAEEVLGILRNKEVDRYTAEQAQKEKNAQDDVYITQAFQHGR